VINTTSVIINNVFSAIIFRPLTPDL
jgi:hypothetical protein